MLESRRPKEREKEFWGAGNGQGPEEGSDL